MGELQRQAERYRLIRRRLEHPKNAVPDHPIDLRRHAQPPVASPDKVWVRPLKTLPPLDKPNPEVDWWTGRMTPAMILHRVAEYYYGKNAIKEFGDLTGPRRAKRYVVPRQIFVYLCFKHIPDATCGCIARAINRDHTTVIYSRSAVVLKLGQPGSGRLEGDIRCIEALIYAGNHANTAVPAELESSFPPPEMGSWNEGPTDVPIAGIPSLDQRSDSELVAAAPQISLSGYPGPIPRGFALLPSSASKVW